MSQALYESTVTVTRDLSDETADLFSSEALEFVATLHRRFNVRRLALLEARAERQIAIDKGDFPDFLRQTKTIRDDQSWKVGPPPADLADRRVEITGPTDRKMMINALNSGAKVFMADFEDSLSPSWENITQGQRNLYDAVRKTIAFPDTSKDKRYTLNDETATLMVRPRGWHLTDKHILVDGEEVSASLLDFGLYFYHNAEELLGRGSGPYYYLAKLESHLEARLWNDVFVAAQETLGIPVGTIKATVLIETILASFEMEEILYELREHSVGLNAGRWDYIFSAIKKFRNHPEMVLPGRAKITMTVPFMRAYTEQLAHICHKRGAHAIGGMSAFIPSRRDDEVNQRAFAKVKEDKEREAGDGCDGTWVAHPDLVPVAQEAFDAILGDQPNQVSRQRDDVATTPESLLSLPDTPGDITEDDIRMNINVALQYLHAWLHGNGAAAIHNLMEDVATAEISRAQLWQWLHNSAQIADGSQFTKERYQHIQEEEISKLDDLNISLDPRAISLLTDLVLQEEFVEFLTLKAYNLL